MKCNLHSLIKFTFIVSAETLIVLQASLVEIIRCLSKLFFRNLGQAVSSLSSSLLRLVKTTSSLNGILECLLSDLLSSESQKLHPQNTLTQPFYEHASH